MSDRRRPNGGISGQAWPSDEGPTKTEPPFDQDVRAALAVAILEADGDATAYGIADAILSEFVVTPRGR